MFANLKVLLSLCLFLWVSTLIGETKNISSLDEHLKITVLDEILEDPDLSTFSKLLIYSSLAGLLEGQGPFTVFAPSNKAFSKLPSGILNEWEKPYNKENLIAILKYHIVLGENTLEDMKKEKGLMTIQGSHLNIKIDKNNMIINNAEIVKSLQYSNGVVHIINQVLIPKY